VVVGAGNNLPLLPLAHRRWDRRIALFVGNEWRRKDGPSLLQAWERVSAALPGARLQVVGVARPPRTLPAGVEWLGIVHDRQRLAELYARASVFVLPSRYEPWGHVFLEAMARGLPCIGTRICAVPEIIRDGETGILVPRRAPGDLARALIALLSDPAAAEAMGRAGQARICAGWTWDEVVARMAPAIEAALG
jgi:glycosyltransferase involved in cell wall biosynthesis